MQNGEALSSPAIQAVVLCGGSGTRLWPLSRKAFPKQFMPLVGDKSLLGLTLERVAPLGPSLCIAAEEHRYLVADAASAAGCTVQQILEPQARNTAPAMALAVSAALRRGGAQELLLFCPADHYIPDGAAFVDMVRAAVPAAMAGCIITFGVLPAFPSTAYGYIERGEPLATGGHRVNQFVEKPQAQRAEQLLLGGKHLWNAGIFLAQAGVLATAIERHAPQIWAACTQAMEGASVDGQFIRPQPQAFASCPSDSIDYAVMEKFDQLAVFPFTGAWSDVGSWNAVADLGQPERDAAGKPTGQGNRSGGALSQAHFLRASNTYIHAGARPVVALGTHNLLIVDTPDALLVAASDHAEYVREAVTALEAAKAPQAAAHRRVARPWGNYDSVDHGPRHQVKRITVRPGGRLSLQMHHHRAEHWVVVSGTALVTRGAEQLTLHENQSVYIPLGVTHRLENPGRIDLEIIEVQSGSYLGEDDIVRFDDAYGRTQDAALQGQAPL